MFQSLKVAGEWFVQCCNADGSLAWECRFKNGINSGALNDLLNVYLGGGTQKTTWYLGLIDNSGFSALSSADTISSHSGWTENTSYDESARPTWTPGAAASGTITNPTSVTFTVNATVAIYGLFIVSNSTKSGTTGQLWATGAFPNGVQNLTSGQTLKASYSLGAA